MKTLPYKIAYMAIWNIAILSFMSTPILGQFQKAYGTALDNSFSKVIKDGGNYYVLGQDESIDGSPMRATVTRLDANGVHQWTISLNIGSIWNDAVRTPAGDLMVVGSTLPLNASNKSLIGLISLSGGGGFTWVRSYDTPGMEAFNRVVKNPVPQNAAFPYYILGSQNQSGASETTDDVIVLNLDASGTFNWKKIYLSDGDDEFSHELEALPNGDLMLGGNDFSGEIFTTDNALNQISGVQISGISFVDILQESNGGFYAAANSLVPGDFPHIIKMDFELFVLWEAGLPQLTSVSQVWEGSQGDIYVTGRGVFGGIDRGVIVKLSGIPIPDVEWVKYFNTGTSFTGGSSWLTPNGQLAYTDARMIPGGFGQLCSFISLSDIDLNACGVTEAFTDLVYFDPIPNGPVAPPVEFYDVPTGVNLMSEALDWQQSEVCAEDTCVADFTFEIDCGVVTFSNQSEIPNTPSWDWSFPGGNPSGSTAQNPTVTFPACGVYQVCLTVTGTGQFGSCENTICRDVEIIDNVPPVTICNGLEVELDANCEAFITPSLIDGGSFDVCQVQSMSVSPSVLEGCGEFPVTLTVTDWCGNTSTCIALVQTLEETPPIITCPGNVTVTALGTSPCSMVVNGIKWLTATDACGISSIQYNVTGATSGSGLNDASGLTFNQGISSVTYTATDECGNTTTCNFTVTVICSPSFCDQQCLVNSINVSTGYNPYFGISQPGQMDAAWSIISAPITIAPLIGPIPRPTFIIGKYGNAWSNTGALWISPYQFNNFTDFNCSGQTPDCATCEPFVYEREFCLCDDDNVTFNLSFLSDDAGSVELWNLNGATPTLIKSLGSNCSSAFANNPLVPLVINTIETLPQGQYSIRLKHWNFVGEPMGVNLEGSISGLHLSKESCCNPIPGGLYVNKFEDTDCNGIQELNVNDWTTTEQGLSGWTFTATNTSNPACSPSSYTAVTNAQGQAFFLNTCFGTYAITESLQTGWTPSSHPTGTQFPIDPPQQGGLQVAEFGNCGCTPGPNLIANADFSAWNSGFTSDYVYGGVSGFGPGVYAVSSRLTLAGPFSCFDHATGLNNLPFLAVDASLTPGLTAWRQVVPIAPSTSYTFSAFVNNLFNPNSNVAEPIVEVWMVDGNNVGTLLVASHPLPELPDVWIKIEANWISPSVLVAPYKIEIRAGSTVHVGNDFAVDDISFQSCTVPRTSICENFNNVYIRSADGALDQSLSCGANPVQLECPGAGSEIIVAGRLDCDSGTLEQEIYLEWELIRLPDSSVASGKVSANPYFAITLAPWYFNLPGSYVLQVAERADPDARCLISFDIDCPDLCPCDDLNFQSDVDRGFVSMISNIGCKACFAPIALNNCDQVNWYINDGDGVPFASSTGAQSVCYHFEEPGIYNIIMEAYRIGSAGSSCETFTKSFPISLTCTPSSTCSNSIMPNSEFSEGAKAGGFNSGGGADGWMAPWGDPHEILGSDGSLDGFSVSLSGNASASDVLTTMEVICIPKDTGTITLRGNVNTSRSNIKTISISLDVDLPGSGPCMDSSCMTIALIDLSALESPGTDSSEWYEFSIPYDIRAWNLPANCGFNGTMVRPSISVTNPLTDDLGDDTKAVFEVDRFCLEDETVSTKNTISINRVNIYPNPTAGHLNIELPFTSGSEIILQVINTTGKLLVEKKAEPGIAVQTMDASVLPQGIYFLQMLLNGQVIAVNKFVKL